MIYISYFLLIIFLLVFSTVMELRLVVVYVCYLYVLEEMGVPGGSACSTYMYDLFVSL